MEKLELTYISGADFYIWERLEELFNAADFSALEEIIELEPLTIRSVKTSRECLETTKDTIATINNDLVKFISDEDLYLLYFSNQ